MDTEWTSSIQKFEEVKTTDLILHYCNSIYPFKDNKIRETERQRDWETERQRDRETERQRDRETERQRDKKIDRETVSQSDTEKLKRLYLRSYGPCLRSHFAFTHKQCSLHTSIYGRRSSLFFQNSTPLFLRNVKVNSGTKFVDFATNLEHVPCIQWLCGRLYDPG